MIQRVMSEAQACQSSRDNSEARGREQGSNPYQLISEGNDRSGQRSAMGKANELLDAWMDERIEYQSNSSISS